MRPVAEISACFSCGARTPLVDGPTHRYMASSPGCWALYGEVLEREYSDFGYGALHRLTVDAYAVQHPGEPSRQSVRSVCMHLAALTAVFRHGMAPGDATGLLQRLAEREDYEWLEPPASLGRLDVTYVHAATGPDDHLARVEAWARAAWLAWKDHHATVEAWLDGSI